VTISRNGSLVNICQKSYIKFKISKELSNQTNRAMPATRGQHKSVTQIDKYVSQKVYRNQVDQR